MKQGKYSGYCTVYSSHYTFVYLNINLFYINHSRTVSFNILYKETTSSGHWDGDEIFKQWEGQGKINPQYPPYVCFPMTSLDTPRWKNLLHGTTSSHRYSRLPWNRGYYGKYDASAYRQVCSVQAPHIVFEQCTRLYPRTWENFEILKTWKLCSSTFSKPWFGQFMWEKFRLPLLLSL